MTPREMEIVELLRVDPTLSQNDIAKKLNISRSTVASHIKNLTASGIITGRGYIMRLDDFIVAIGASNIDVIGISDKRLKKSDSNPGTIKYSSGGVCRNIVENMAKLGLKVSFMTALGSDEAGKIIRSELLKYKVDMNNSLILDKNTSHYLAIMDDERDLYIAISDMELVDEIDVDFLKPRAEFISRAKFCVLDTNLKEESLNYLLNNIRTKFLIDGVSSAKVIKLKNLLDKIHFLKLNANEANMLANKDDIEKNAIEILKMGTKSLVITDGKNGAHYFDLKNHYFQPAKKIDPVDATGAGDAFMAAYVYTLFNDYTIAKRMEFATSASSLVLKHEGTSCDEFNVKNIEGENEF